MDNKDKPPVIETASATSSSEENKSGPFAYILFGSVLGISLVLAIICGGCTSAIVAAAVSEDGTSTFSGPTSQQFPYDDIEDLDDLEEWLRLYSDEYGDGGLDTSGGSNSKMGTCTVDEALDFDLAPYDISLASEVSASAYANTPSGVRDFVRKMVNADDEYATKVARCLHDAARDEDKQQEKIEEALALCDEAKKAINDIAIPSVDADKNGTLKDDLGSAKSQVTKRWEATREELAILKTTDEVSKRELWDSDEQTLDTVDDAVQMLEDAMASSSTAKSGK